VRLVGVPVASHPGSQRGALGPVVTDCLAGQFRTGLRDPVGQQGLQQLVLSGEVLVERADGAVRFR
jgi:hypothetical protein